MLFVALAVIVVLLIGNELLYVIQGGRSIGPTEAVRMINESDAIIVDVRGEKEYRKSHIVNARHFSHQEMEPEPKGLAQLKDKDLIVYAATDSAAAQARDKLSKKGYSAVVSLKGGLNAWQGASLPVSSK